MTTTQFYLQPVSLQQAQQIYEQHMTRDFPPAELKPFAMIRQGMQQGSYDFLALYRTDDALMGYAVLVAEPGQPAALLDYYAVLPQTRGSGVGAAGLQLLRQYYAPQKDSILIESEYPAEAPDPALAERRLGFYIRGGARKTSIAERLFGVRYTIFSLDCSAQGSARSESELEQALQGIYRRMIPGTVCAQAVQFGAEAIPYRPTVEWG